LTNGIIFSDANTVGIPTRYHISMETTIDAERIEYNKPTQTKIGKNTTLLVFKQLNFFDSIRIF